MLETTLPYSGPLSLLLITLLGYFLSRFQFSSKQLALFLSRLLIWVCYPSLIFLRLTENFTKERFLTSWKLILIPPIIFLIGYLAGRVILKAYIHQHPRTQQTLGFLATVPNYIFLPVAIAAVFYSEKTQAALILASIGAELALWGAAIPMIRRGRIFGRQLINPPIVVALVSLAFIVFEIPTPHLVKAAEDQMGALGKAAIPVSFFLLGHYLGTTPMISRFGGPHWAIILIRLIIVPILSFFPIYLLTDPNEVRQVMLLVATMPAAIASVVLCSVYQGDVRIAGGLVLATQAIGLITVPFWMLIGYP
ncbi:MAG: AEC family transporter [Pseudobacteriovorax sp.]|nr:AEC family transporter [Pseudobacteriovorax sp.]